MSSEAGTQSKHSQQKRSRHGLLLGTGHKLRMSLYIHDVIMNCNTETVVNVQLYIVLHSRSVRDIYYKSKNACKYTAYVWVGIFRQIVFSLSCTEITGKKTNQKKNNF